MMLFQPKLGLSMHDLLGRSACSRRWTPLQKQETNSIDEGSPVAAPIPKSVLSGGRKFNCLGNEFSVCITAYLSLMGWPGIYNG